MKKTLMTLFSVAFLHCLQSMAQTLREISIPRYMSGRTHASTNNSRIPVPICIQLDGLTPNVDIFLRVGIGSTTGAATNGTTIYGDLWCNQVTAMGGSGTTNVLWDFSFNSNQYNKVKVNGKGSTGPVWVYYVPSANTSAPFTPGTEHYVKVSYSTTSVKPGSATLFSTSTIKCLEAAKSGSALSVATNDDGAYVVGTTDATNQGKLVLLYDNVAGLGQPIAIARVRPHLQADMSFNGTSTTRNTTDYDSLPLVVANIIRGNATSGQGTYACMVPSANTSSRGIKRIELRDTLNNLIDYTVDPDGVWPSAGNTTNLTRAQIVNFSISDAPLNSNRMSAYAFGNKQPGTYRIGLWACNQYGQAKDAIDVYQKSGTDLMLYYGDNVYADYAPKHKDRYGNRGALLDTFLSQNGFNSLTALIRDSVYGNSTLINGVNYNWADYRFLFDLDATGNPNQLDSIATTTPETQFFHAYLDLDLYQTKGGGNFRKLRNTIPYLATWDDHDYGKNNAKADFANKDMGKKSFEKFWRLSSLNLGSAYPTGEGVYNSASVSIPNNRTLRVIMLDNRWYQANNVGGFGELDYILGPSSVPNPFGGWVGKTDSTQWTWLQNELNQPADIYLIVSGVHILTDDNAMESWDGFEEQRNKLFRMVDAMGLNKNVFFISGDKHFGAVSYAPLATDSINGTTDVNYRTYTTPANIGYHEFHFAGINTSETKKNPQYFMNSMEFSGSSGPNTGFIDVTDSSLIYRVYLDSSYGFIYEVNLAKHRTGNANWEEYVYNGINTINPNYLNTLLPVKLTSFTGIHFKNEVQLMWKTASEKNNNMFEVERSEDGIHFHKIASIKGNGNSNVQSSYRYTDHQLPKIMQVYYRLKQIDFDGKYQYSHIIKVNLLAEKPFELTVYPNPLKDNDHLFLQSADNGKALIRITTIAGTVISEQTVEITQGENSLALDHLSPGLYFLQVTINNQSQVIRIVK